MLIGFIFIASEGKKNILLKVLHSIWILFLTVLFMFCIHIIFVIFHQKMDYDLQLMGFKIWLCFENSNPCLQSPSWRQRVRKKVHFSLHLLALGLGMIGIYMDLKYHNESGIVNLYCWHSWLGLGTIFLFGIQVHSTIVTSILSTPQMDECHLYVIHIHLFTLRVFLILWSFLDNLFSNAMVYKRCSILKINPHKLN